MLARGVRYLVWGSSDAPTKDAFIASTIKRTILPHQADALPPREVVGNLIELILGAAVVSAGQLVEDDGGRSGHPRSADLRGRGRSGREEPDSTVYW